MSAPRGLPRTPRELFRLRGTDRYLYNGTIAFFETTGLWKYPIKTHGDLERMTVLDKIYWLYKTTNPVDRAWKGSGLEAHFEKQESFEWELPAGFVAESSATLSAVGDLISHEFLANSGDTLYSDVSELLFGVDLPMANLECNLVPCARGSFEFSPKAGPPLYFSSEEFEVIRGRGFQFMATACNHSLDFGMEGVQSTISALDRAGIAFNGLNRSEAAADTATLIERKGIKLGLIAHTFGLNNYKAPPERPRVVNVGFLNDGPELCDLEPFRRQIEFCRREKADFVIAHLHWGYEHEFYPRPEQVALARRLAELGVDAVIGHHPHVIQPVEFYRTSRDPARVVPIYYSLGNLVNAFSAPYLCRSGLALLELAKGRDSAGELRTYVRSASMRELEQKVDIAAKKVRIVAV